jgi:murein DD-endopeptidase MepM/ murein hydrolase activator NlpD
MKNKIVWFIITMAFVVILPFNLNVKAAQELCESDQVISGYNPLSQTSIIAYSPFRVGDTGTGSDYLATITSQYNQPRYESGIKRVHIGVDLQALNSNNLGRNVFSVYGAGKVVATGTSPSYGEYVTIEHKHTSGGKEYYFQSFYAHLASRTLTSTTPTYTVTLQIKTDPVFHNKFPRFRPDISHCN